MGLPTACRNYKGHRWGEMVQRMAALQKIQRSLLGDSNSLTIITLVPLLCDLR